MNKYIIQVYNTKTNNIIGYINDRYNMIDNIEKCFSFDEDLGLDSFAREFIDNVYKKHTDYTILQHEFEHIKEDYFKDINRYDVWFRILDKDIELRRLKIGKIKKVSFH